MYLLNSWYISNEIQSPDEIFLDNVRYEISKRDKVTVVKLLNNNNEWTLVYALTRAVYMNDPNYYIKIFSFLDTVENDLNWWWWLWFAIKNSNSYYYC